MSDISTLAKSLRTQFAGRTAAPGHVELLNMLARGAGYRNFQQLRATACDNPIELRPAGNAAEAGPCVDLRLVERTARHFDAHGVLLRWPARASQQRLCLSVFWAAFPPRQVLDERAVNAFLATRHSFGDPALLRRALYDAGFVSRTRDGREYRRIERAPSPEAGALIARIGARPDRPGAAP